MCSNVSFENEWPIVTFSLTLFCPFGKDIWEEVQSLPSDAKLRTDLPADKIGFKSQADPLLTMCPPKDLNKKLGYF